MAYSRSVYRKDFEERLLFLRHEVVKASKLPVMYHNLRDMAFQCAIFQTSAALESYLKLILESWVSRDKEPGYGRINP